MRRALSGSEEWSEGSRSPIYANVRDSSRRSSGDHRMPAKAQLISLADLAGYSISIQYVEDSLNPEATGALFLERQNLHRQKVDSSTPVNSKVLHALATTTKTRYLVWWDPT